MILGNVLASILVHVLLRLFREKSTLSETLTLYTVVFIYNPILTIFNLPGLGRSYNQLRWIKTNGLSFADSLKTLRDNPSILGDTVPIQIGAISTSISGVITAITEVMFGRIFGPMVRNISISSLLMCGYRGGFYYYTGIVIISSPGFNQSVFTYPIT
jgi:hypothetical protein